MLDTQSMPAIDMHSHIETPELIDLLRSERMTYAMLMAHDNRKLLKLAEQHTDLVGVLIWVLPQLHDWRDEALHLIEQHPKLIKGFKIHPAWDGYTAEVDLLEGLWALANERNLMIETHTEPGSCNAGRFKPLMQAFPQTKLILIHGCPGYEAFDVVNSFPNVFIDTSFTAWGRDYQAAALKAVGKTKIMMGLDSPLGFPYTKQGKPLPHFRQAIGEIAGFYDNDPDVVEHVMYKNARGLLDSL
jgi:predicted TIM-barrel fold metal-dependent hydrolase